VDPRSVATLPPVSYHDASRRGPPTAFLRVSKQSLLLVDGDARSLRVLEVSLRKAGFTVTTAVNGPDALEKLALSTPDLVISETKLEEMDGYELCKQLKANPAWAEIPFVFLTAQTGIEHKVKGLELGVDDYLTKPIYIKEVVTRLQILLQKRQRTRIEERRDGRTRFVGRLSDMAVVDLIQTIEISRKSGVIQFTGEVGRQAAIYFRDGKVIDAEAGPLQGEDAVYRLLTWNDGAFEVVFRTVRRRDVITTPSQGLLMEGMRRLDEWTRLCEQLPPLETRFEVDTRELTQRLGDIPDENNTILKLMDGRRTLNEVIDACSVGDLECLQAVSRLYFEGLLIEAHEGRAVDAERRVVSGTVKTGDDSSQWIVPATVFDETPVEAERIIVGATRQSGPHQVARVVTVPPPLRREGSGPRTLPPPPPPGRRGSGSGPIPTRSDVEPRSGPIAIARTDSGRIPTVRPEIDSGPEVAEAATMTESGRFAAPPAEPLPDLAPPGAGPQSDDYEVVESVDELRRTLQRPAVVPPPDAVPEEQRMRSPSGSIEVGELAGSFRPSGLRKIDEAVRAAQLIAPELFAADDLPSLPSLVSPAALAAAAGGASAASAAPPGPVTESMPVPTAAELAAADEFAEEPSYVYEADMGSVPEEYLDDEDPAPSRGHSGIAAGLGASPLGADAVLAADGASRSVRNEGSGARMLASYGAERAQVSGELPFRPSEWPEKETTARELVTIKPRRITREMPAVVPSPELMAEVEAAELAEAARVAGRPAATSSAAMASTTIPAATDGLAGLAGARTGKGPPLAATTTTAVERPRPPSRPPRTGSGTSRSAAVDTQGTIGWMPWIFGAVGVALMASAYIRCRNKAAKPPVVATMDATTSVAVETPDAAPSADAAQITATQPDARQVAVPAASDARVAVARADAREVAPTIDAAPNTRKADAAALRDAASESLADSDYEAAIELADKSLALIKSARTYLIKADALRKLDRVDEAIATVDAAIARGQRYAPSWELKGRILWGQRRTEEARAAFEKYLELKPTGSTADRIRELIGE
jgi:DNA-binding response OmpR family regulator